MCRMDGGAVLFSEPNEDSFDSVRFSPCGRFIAAHDVKKRLFVYGRGESREGWPELFVRERVHDTAEQRCYAFSPESELFVPQGQ